jgi:hypothetical protein
VRIGLVAAGLFLKRLGVLGGDINAGDDGKAGLDEKVPGLTEGTVGADVEAEEEDDEDEDSRGD